MPLGALWGETKHTGGPLLVPGVFVSDAGSSLCTSPVHAMLCLQYWMWYHWRTAAMVELVDRTATITNRRWRQALLSKSNASPTSPAGPASLVGILLLLQRSAQLEMQNLQ